MAQNNTVSISIGAALKSSFSTTLGGGRKQLKQMGDALKAMEVSGKRITTFQKLKSEVVTANTAWKQAEDRVKRLSAEIKKTANPTAKMQRELDKAKNAAKRAKTVFDKKRESLRNVRGEMKAAGQSTRNLAVQQAKLGASVDRLRGKYSALDQAMKRGDAIKSRRAALRGQMLDMVALGAAIGAPLKAAIDFESEMADVRKVMEFKEGEAGLKKFGKELRVMSRTIPISAAGLAQIAAAGGQLGVKEKELGKFVRIASEMSVAFDVSPEEAGDSMAKLSNVFKIPVTEMNKLGDAINHLSDNTAARAREMVDVLKRSGGLAKDFGLTAEQTAALADTFIAMGVPTEKVSTALNALLLKLNTAEQQGGKFQSALAELGFEASSLKDAINNDAQGALSSFLEAVDQVDQKDRTGILANLFGQQFVDEISILAGGVDNYNKALGLLKEDKKIGSMTKEFENRSRTTANSLQLLSNQFTEIGINVGSTLLPPLNALVNNVLRPLSTVFAELAERSPFLTSLIFGVTFGLIGLKIAAIGLGFAWTFVLGGANALVVGFRGLQAALAFANIQFKAFNVVTLISAARLKLLAFGGMIKAFGASLIGLASRAIPIVIGAIRALTIAFMTNPIGLVIGGIALIAGYLLSQWQPVRDFFASIWDSVKPAWETFFGWIQQAWEWISTPLTAIGELWDSIFGDGKKVDATITTSEESGQIQRTLSDADTISGNVRDQNITYNNEFKITVTGEASNDVRRIADEVIKRIREESRGALFDTAGAIG